MAAVSMGRFAFYAHASVISNLFNFGLGTKDIAGGGLENAATTFEIKTKKEATQNPTQKELDLITNLPGLDFDPGFDQYSGYLRVDEDHHREIFYWYVESQGDPENDPLLFWTNGGPGCSGLLGWGTEHGPFYINADGKLSPNPFSWNKLANVLYVETPAGVGFSYSKHKKDYITGDKETAADNYKVIQKFLERFPERRSNDFYISSESYGGHYMPQLTNEILRHNTDGHLKFKGMMVGNPFVDSYTTTISQFQAWYGNGLLPWPLYKKYAENCHYPEIYFDGECLDYIHEMYQELGKGINYYALDYPRCLEQDSSKQQVKSSQALDIAATGGTTAQDSNNHHLRQLFGSSQQSAQLLNQTATALLHSGSNYNPPFLPVYDHFRVCADNHFIKYLNRDDVVAAIHAKPDLPPWSECNDHVFHTYSKKDSLSSQVHLYQDLVKTIQHDTPLHILVYSGDNDSICSLACTQKWIWDLGVRPKHSSYWEPWVVQNQTAGFVTRFHLKNKTSSKDASFTFVTVHGAGHEVPLYRPMEALELLRRFLSHEW